MFNLNRPRVEQIGATEPPIGRFAVASRPTGRPATHAAATREPPRCHEIVTHTHSALRAAECVRYRGRRCCCRRCRRPIRVDHTGPPAPHHLRGMARKCRRARPALAIATRTTTTLTSLQPICPPRVMSDQFPRSQQVAVVGGGACRSSARRLSLVIVAVAVVVCSQALACECQLPQQATGASLASALAERSAATGPAAADWHSSHTTAHGQPARRRITSDAAAHLHLP
jgi:hypothetical protein